MSDLEWGLICFLRSFYCFLSHSSNQPGGLLKLCVVKVSEKLCLILVKTAVFSLDAGFLAIEFKMLTFSENLC